MATRNNLSAFIATHPGEVLAAELEERGITQKAAKPCASATLQVSVEDTSILEEIRRAISLIQGVCKVAVL